MLLLEKSEGNVAVVSLYDVFEWMQSEKADEKVKIIVMSCTFLNDERQTHFLCFFRARQDSALKFRIFSISLFMFKRSKIASQKITKFPASGEGQRPVSFTKIVFCEKFKFKARDSASADAVQTPEQSKCHQLPTVSLTKLTTATTTFALISPSKSKYETPNCPFSP